MRRVALYAHTLRHLRPVQVINRVRRRFGWPLPAAAALPPLRERQHPFIAGPHRPATLLGPSEFVFLDRSATISSAGDWNSAVLPKLWLYQLHYFDDLVAEQASQRTAWHRSLLERWRAENPVGAGVGWDPYPTSLRIVNWIKWSLSGNSLTEDLLASLVVQVRYLEPRIELHLLANHLFENYKAIAVAGCFFGGHEGDRWLQAGLTGLQDQLGEQVLADGGHFELAPMYQGLVLEGLLDVINVLTVYGHGTPAFLADAVRRMCRWSLHMCHADGDWAHFNDTSLGYAATPGALVAYARRLGHGVPEAAEPLVNLPESGFVRAELAGWLLLADVGGLGPAYNPAHGHADTLTFELSRGSSRVIVDTGVSTYEVGPRRAYERSTQAHNTVAIDGEDSSEVWESFRVARRARVIELEVNGSSDGAVITAAHDGFSRLSGRPVHRRRWSIDAAALIVRDEIEGAGTHRVQCFIHFAPGLQLRKENSGHLSIDAANGTRIAQFECANWPDIRVEECLLAPSFGRLERAQRVVLSADVSGRARFEFRVSFAKPPGSARPPYSEDV